MGVMMPLQEITPDKTIFVAIPAGTPTFKLLVLGTCGSRTGDSV